MSDPLQGFDWASVHDPCSFSESDWLAAADPAPMLAFLRGKASDRKVRLFGCAACRLIWSLFPDPANRALVAAVEDHPDGKFQDPDIDAAIVTSGGWESGASDRDKAEHGDAYLAVKYLGRTFYKFTPLECIDEVVSYASAADPRPITTSRMVAALRDIFNPFRPLAL